MPSTQVLNIVFNHSKSVKKTRKLHSTLDAILKISSEIGTQKGAKEVEYKNNN